MRRAVLPFESHRRSAITLLTNTAALIAFAGATVLAGAAPVSAEEPHKLQTVATAPATQVEATAGVIEPTLLLPLWLMPPAAAAATGTADSAAVEPIDDIQIRPLCRGLQPTIMGTSGADVLHGTDGPDVIYAGAGDDSVYGRAGDDVVCGGPGNDRLVDPTGRNSLFGEHGNDFVMDGSIEGSFLDGGDGSDELVGSKGSVLRGGDGNDRLTGGSSLHGDAGADELLAAPRPSVLRGGPDDDRLVGSSGNDHLYGEAGRDTIEGHSGADLLDGGDGNDRLDASVGSEGRTDTLRGGSGDDDLRFADGDDPNTIKPCQLVEDNWDCGGPPDSVDAGIGYDFCSGDSLDNVTACEWGIGWKR